MLKKIPVLLLAFLLGALLWSMANANAGADAPPKYLNLTGHGLALVRLGTDLAGHRLPALAAVGEEREGADAEDFTATLLASGKVLIVGGASANIGLNTQTEVYDPVTGNQKGHRITTDGSAYCP